MTFGRTSRDFVTISEFDAYINTIDVVEDAIDDDDKFPVVNDNKTKRCCQMTLELAKLLINYVKFNIKDGTKKKREH